MFQILDNAKKKKLIEKISNLGIKKAPYLLIRIGKERVLAYSGAFSREELSALSNILSIEGLGTYFGKELEDKTFRLSLDMLHLLKEQITENRIYLTKEQEEKWFYGENIELTIEQQENYKKLSSFIVVYSSDEYKDILGTGKISQDKKIVFNFLPKERRIRKN